MHAQCTRDIPQIITACSEALHRRWEGEIKHLTRQGYIMKKEGQQGMKGENDKGNNKKKIGSVASRVVVLAPVVTLSDKRTSWPITTGTMR